MHLHRYEKDKLLKVNKSQKISFQVFNEWTFFSIYALASKKGLDQKKMKALIRGYLT